MLRRPVRPRRRGALLAIAVTTALALGPTPGAVADSRPTLAPDELLSVASQAAGWLAGTQFGPDGALKDPTGKPDPVATAWSVLAIRAAGLTSEADAPTRWLQQNIGLLARDGQGESPTGLALAVLVAHTQQLPLETFGGQDLVGRLLALRGKDGLYGPAGTGLGSYDPLGDVAIRQALVLSALGAAGRTDADAATWLERRECPDGGWALQQIDAPKACVASPYTTGYAMEGLAAVGREVPRRAVRALSQLQRPDGGFGQIFPESDALATAVALQGLIAAGVDPNTDRWRKGSGADASTPFLALLRFSGNSGGFSTVQSSMPDPGVTARVAIAAAGQPLPLLPSGPQPEPGGNGSGGSGGDTSSATGSNGTTTGSQGFSGGVLVGGGVGALVVIGGFYVLRRRRQTG